MSGRLSERPREDEHHRAAYDARERDDREARLRTEVLRLERVVRSMRAAIDEERRTDDHGTQQEGQP